MLLVLFQDEHPELGQPLALGRQFASEGTRSSGVKHESREWEMKGMFDSAPLEHDEYVNAENYCVAI